MPGRISIANLNDQASPSCIPNTSLTWTVSALLNFDLRSTISAFTPTTTSKRAHFDYFSNLHCIRSLSLAMARTRLAQARSCKHSSQWRRSFKPSRSQARDATTSNSPYSRTAPCSPPSPSLSSPPRSAQPLSSYSSPRSPRRLCALSRSPIRNTHHPSHCSKPSASRSANRQSPGSSVWSCRWCDRRSCFPRPGWRCWRFVGSGGLRYAFAVELAELTPWVPRLALGDGLSPAREFARSPRTPVIDTQNRLTKSDTDLFLHVCCAHDCLPRSCSSCNDAKRTVGVELVKVRSG